MEWLNLKDERFWQRLLIIGLVLNLIVVLTSDLGLDTHVRMAANEDGELPWGHTRPDDPHASDANDGGIVSSPISESESMVRIQSALQMIVLIAIAGMISIRLAALVSIYPTFIFSTGRAYQEVGIAIYTAVAVIFLCYYFNRSEGNEKSLIKRWDLSGKPIHPGFAILAGISLCSILQIKGIITMESAVLAGGLIGFMAFISSKFGKVTVEKIALSTRVIGIVVGGGVMLSMIILGFLGYGGTLSVIGDAPLRYVSALAFSILGVMIIYTFFGMMLWPFIPAMWKMMAEKLDYNSTRNFIIISAFSAAITTYVAALWTYESLLWDSRWPWVIWTMGNNGRYISMLMIPWFLLLSRLWAQDPSLPSLEEPKSQTKPLLIAILLVLPLSIITAVHGQTMWTDEAANAMELDSGEHFLFVSDSDLGMHWLYTFYQPLNAEENNITGHWRSDQAPWLSELENNLSHVNVIVIAPEISELPVGWSQSSSGDVRLLNGGGQWRILLRDY
jgi:hypothetical protein